MCFEEDKMKCLADCIFNLDNKCILKGRYINQLGVCSELIFRKKEHKKEWLNQKLIKD